jgi:hypothetical protein
MHPDSQAHLLSLAGVFAQSKLAGQRLPVALSQYMEDYLAIQRIELHLDNDPAGRTAAKGIAALLNGKVDVSDCLPTFGKDVNDELRHKLGLGKASPERSKIR